MQYECFLQEDAHHILTIFYRVNGIQAYLQEPTYQIRSERFFKFHSQKKSNSTVVSS